MENDVTITLTGPARIDGKRHPAGTILTVSAPVALQLAASGVINPDAARAVSFDMPMSADFEKAVAAEVERRVVGTVAAAVAERDAHWSSAFDHFETMAEDRLAAALDAKRAEPVKPKNAGGEKPPAQKVTK